MNKKALKLGLTVITVGPHNVDEHLKKCKSNRARQKKHVHTWVRAIKKGHFRDRGLIFADENGDYDDGQHRLWAVKITGHTAVFLVISGVEREALNMMLDGGKKRTNADRLKNAQVKYAPLICASIEEIMDVREQWKRSVAMLLPDEVLGFYHTHQNQLDALASAYTHYKDIPARLLVAFNFLFALIDVKKCDEYFAALTHRSLLKPGHPLYAFYQMLASDTVVNDQNGGRVNRYIRNGLIQAWNAFFKGEELQAITPNERYITLEGTAVIAEDADDENGDTNGEPEIEVENDTDEVEEEVIA